MMNKHTLSFLASLLFISLFSSANGIYIYRDKDDWAYLTFTERGIVQNIVKCNPEVKDICQADPTYLKSPLAAYTVSTIDLIKNDPKYHETAKVLIIGMGPAALGRFLHHYFPNMQIDHVEINEDLVREVNNSIPLPVSSKFQVIVQDALKFINNEISAPSKKQRRYDIIIHDAYDSVGPVRILNTLPFFNGMKKLLENATENGIVVTNFWATNITLTREIANKYKEVFGNVRVVGVPRTGGEMNCAFISHSMTKKDDLVCTDMICKSKRSKASRSKVSPICADVSEYAKIAGNITKSVNMSLNLENVVTEAFASRPLPIEDYC